MDDRLSTSEKQSEIKSLEGQLEKQYNRLLNSFQP